MKKKYINLEKTSKCEFCGYTPSYFGYDCIRMYAYNCCEDAKCIKKWAKKYLKGGK